MAAKLPRISVQKLRKLTTSQSAFLTIERHVCRTILPDGAVSDEFVYDAVQRRALHAAIIVAHYEEGGECFVYLRSCLRPPLAGSDIGHPEEVGLWELPAGLIEPGEKPAESAARELKEELGFTVASAELRPLGGPVFPAPGMIGEKQYFFHVPVRPSERTEPELDGSPLEQGGVVSTLPLEQALNLVKDGGQTDAKTELGLRRFLEHLDQ